MPKFADVTITQSLSMGAEARVEGDLIPDTADSRSLGDASHRFQKIYSVDPIDFPVRTIAVPFIVDGGGSVITTGSKGYVVLPINCTLKSWELLADVTGSIVVDVKRANFTAFPTTASITGTDKPTLVAAQKNSNGGPLINWTAASMVAGDVLEFNVDSAATVKRLLVSLTATIP